VPASKKDLLPQARALYAQGRSLGQVAEQLAVSAATLSRWKSADARAGVDWLEQRETYSRKDPHALLAILEQQRQDLVASGGIAAPDYADKALKLQRVIESIRKEFPDVDAIDRALKRYARYLRDHAPDKHLQESQVHMAGFLAQLAQEIRE